MVRFRLRKPRYEASDDSDDHCNRADDCDAHITATSDGSFRLETPSRILAWRHRDAPAGAAAAHWSIFASTTCSLHSFQLPFSWWKIVIASTVLFTKLLPGLAVVFVLTRATANSSSCPIKVKPTSSEVRSRSLNSAASSFWVDS